MSSLLGVDTRRLSGTPTPSTPTSYIAQRKKLVSDGVTSPRRSPALCMALRKVLERKQLASMITPEALPTGDPHGTPTAQRDCGPARYPGQAPRLPPL